MLKTTVSSPTDVQVYFCDPQSPWHCGSNENTNGLLRQYLPKKEDLSCYSQSDLDEIALRLINGHEKRWDFKLRRINSKPVLRRPRETTRLLVMWPHEKANVRESVSQDLGNSRPISPAAPQNYDPEIALFLRELDNVIRWDLALH
jgi:hypothetical protein